MKPFGGPSLHTALAATLALALGACAPYRVVDVPSTNQSSRVAYVVLHFTSESFGESLRLLTQPSDYPVSSHYLIPESGDPTYPRSRPMLYRLVPEHRRAWHAGVSDWAGADSLNDRSIGIELVNRSACTREDPAALHLPPLADTCRFLPYDPAQLDLLVTLLRDLLARYPDIEPVNIVAHSDIAPQRKVDPGPLFPWRRLAELGIGAWYDDDAVARHRAQLAERQPSTAALQAALKAYGYETDTDGVMDKAAQRVVRAFQLHFTPDNVTGQFDLETVAVLFALIEKYRPDELAAA
ncbi:MAG: N-acetylmuramoyl-L-alanine amidase, partial [Pseudomonadota bacterium]